MKNVFFKTLVTMVLVFSMMILPVSAAGSGSDPVSPCFDHTESVSLTIGFDKNNVVYCGLTVELFPLGRGTSGVMFLYDSNGNVLQQWPISDYEEPITALFTYQGTYGETYTLNYQGYVYGTGLVVPDRIDVTTSGRCVD